MQRNEIKIVLDHFFLSPSPSPLFGKKTMVVVVVWAFPLKQKKTLFFPLPFLVPLFPI